MNEWEKVLVLGTDHYVLTPEIRQIYLSLGLDPTLNDTSFMRFSLAMQVGLTKISAPFSGLDDDDISAPIYTQKENINRSDEKKWTFQQLHFLKSICKNKDYLFIHIELFDLLQKEKCFIPTVLLPGLFDISSKDAIFFSKLKPVISENGYRLLEKNRKWNSLLATTDENQWYTGTLQERMSLLTYLTTHIPQKAVDLLLSTWKEDNLNEKIQFLTQLEKMDVSPSSSFIKLISEDNEVETLQILTRIRCKLFPEDKTLVVFKKELLRCLDITDNGLHIHLPDVWPSNWTQQGLQPEGALPFSPSKKKNAFLPAFSMFNPSIWNEKLNVTPEKFLSLLAKESIYKPGITYLATAILHYKHREWAYHLLHHWIASEENNESIRQIIPSFLVLFTHTESIKLTQEYLLHQKEPLEKDSLIYAVLMNPNMTWSEKNTHHLQYHLANIWEKYLSRGFFAFEHYAGLFLLYAKRCQIDEGINEEGWLESLDIPVSQPTLYNDFLEIINIRRKIFHLL